MVEDMKNVFRAIADKYCMRTQYEETLNSLLNSGEFRVKHIWKKLTLLIDWVKQRFSKEESCNILGKKYDLDDRILYRIQKHEDKKISSNGEELKESKKYETWLMSDLFRYVENQAKQNDPIHKYVGKIKFTKLVNRVTSVLVNEKVIKRSYEGEYDTWTPSMKNENGEDADVSNIRIEVYNDDGTPRRYELEYGWNDTWSKEKAPWENDKNFLEFERQWGELKNKMKIPGWYRFDPRNPKIPETGHNLMKEWDEDLFNSFKHQNWNDTMADTNHPVEKSDFIIDCSKLLGIGGEGIVIKKSASKPCGSTIKEHHDEVCEALKIIPVMEATENLKTVYRRKTNKLRHDSIIDYSDIYLDVIRIFGQKVFVMVIGKILMCKGELKEFFRPIFSYLRVISQINII